MKVAPPKIPDTIEPEPSSDVVQWIDLTTTLPEHENLAHTALHTAVSKQPQRHIIVLLQDPITNLAYRLEHCPFEEAVGAWRRNAEALLELQRKSRRRVSLVDPATLINPTEEEKRIISEKLPRMTVDEIKLPKFQMPTHLNVSCAFVVIQTDPALQITAANLRAATIGGLRTPDMRDVARSAWEWHHHEQEKWRQKIAEANRNVELTQQSADAEKSRNATIEVDLKSIRDELQHISTERDLLRETLSLQSETLLVAASTEAELHKHRTFLDLEKKEARSLQDALSKKTREIEALQTRLDHRNDDYAKLQTQAESAQQKLIEADYISKFRSLVTARLTDDHQPPVIETTSNHALRMNRPKDAIPGGFNVFSDWTDLVLPGQAGKRIGSIIRSQRAEGHIFYGPYLPIEDGAYAADAILNLESGITSSNYFLEVDIDGKIIANAKIALHRGHNRFLVPFYVSTNLRGKNCEIRVQSPGKAIVSLQRLQILRTGRGHGAPTAHDIPRAKPNVS